MFDPEKQAKEGLKWRLQIGEHRRDGVLVLALAGRIGHRAAADLGSRLERAIAAGDRRLVLDFSGVDYLSSPGALALDAASTRLQPLAGGLVLAGVTEPVRLVLELTGALGRLVIEPTTDRAAARLAVEFPP